MKKILSLTLAVLMVVSMIPTAFAAETQDYSLGTAVTYTADSEANRGYTITVPASLAPGASGTVTLEGTWPSNETVTVTAEKTVTLENSINANDTKVLDITFPGISEAGSNTGSQKFTETVSVAAMPSDALFGVWSGHFNYNVELVEEEAATIISFSIRALDGVSVETYSAEEGMTWGEWVESEYNTLNFIANENGVGSEARLRASDGTFPNQSTVIVSQETYTLTRT